MFLSDLLLINNKKPWQGKIELLDTVLTWIKGFFLSSSQKQLTFAL